MENVVSNKEGEAILADRNSTVRVQATPPAQSPQELPSRFDFSEQSKAEEDRARLAALVESSEDAIISKSLEGIVTSWNEGARRLFGYSAEEMLGQPVSRIIPAERSEEEAQIVARLRRGERVEQYETVAPTQRRADGRCISDHLADSGWQRLHHWGLQDRP